MMSAIIPFKGPRGVAEGREMASHVDTSTTQLYDRRGDAVSFDECVRVGA
jgi:hypothetical protein